MRHGTKFRRMQRSKLRSEAQQRRTRCHISSPFSIQDLGLAGIVPLGGARGPSSLPQASAATSNGRCRERVPILGRRDTIPGMTLSGSSSSTPLQGGISWVPKMRSNGQANAQGRPKEKQRKGGLGLPQRPSWSHRCHRLVNPVSPHCQQFQDPLQGVLGLLGLGAKERVWSLGDDHQWILSFSH